ncbi:hypothetical protein [Pseudomonas sp. CGJS7]|uniref:hypothetical protein n=1 Tax=Pseudomonas sp. CGJS7 TaxID=3109348 RepID=UPI00300BC5A1
MSRIAWACGLLVVAIAGALAVAALASRSGTSVAGLSEVEPLAMIVDENPDAGTLRAQQRERLILREVGELGSGDTWAGRYVWSSGFAFIRMSVAPKSGAVLLYGTDVVDSGVQLEAPLRTGADGSIQAQWSEFTLRARIPFVSAALVPIRWGERRYLVDAERLPQFAEQINLRYEPRVHSIVRPPALALLREGDELKPVSGLPQLPNGPLAGVRLAPEPIRVLEVATVGRRQEEGDCSTDYRFVLGQGSNQGLSIGELLDMKAGEIQGRIQVSDVGPEQSRALWSQEGCGESAASLRSVKVVRPFFNPAEAQMALDAALLERSAHGQSR